MVTTICGHNRYIATFGQANNRLWLSHDTNKNNAHVRKHVCRHVCVDICVGMYMDICRDMDIDRHMRTFAQTCINL